MESVACAVQLVVVPLGAEHLATAAVLGRLADVRQMGLVPGQLFHIQGPRGKFGNGLGSRAKADGRIVIATQTNRLKTKE